MKLHLQIHIAIGSLLNIQHGINFLLKNITLQLVIVAGLQGPYKSNESLQLLYVPKFQFLDAEIVTIYPLDYAFCSF